MGYSPPTLMGKTHTLIGGTSAVVACRLFGVQNASAVVFVGTAVIGSVLPDADDADATIHQPTALEKRYELLGGLGFIARLPLRLCVLLPHRGPTHWPPTCAGLVYALEQFVAWVVAAGMGLGYALHLAADGCTKDGIPLWPGQRLWLLPRVLRIRTGKKAEGVLVLLWVVGTVMVLASLGQG
jgi:membrane-bound metal-dependent hydrolase YbcI (DUF457 family)